MKNKLYVGNLAYEISENDLEQVFNGYGRIEEVKIVKDSFTGKNRGFGFVTYKDPEDAAKALEVDGRSVNGRNLKVLFANDRRPLASFHYRSRGFK